MRNGGSDKSVIICAFKILIRWTFRKPWKTVPNSPKCDMNCFRISSMSTIRKVQTLECTYGWGFMILVLRTTIGNYRFKATVCRPRRPNISNSRVYAPLHRAGSRIQFLVLIKSTIGADTPEPKMILEPIQVRFEHTWHLIFSSNDSFCHIRPWSH